MNLEINKRVVYYRKQKHLTQATVAERIGMKSSTYSQMEREGDISADRIVKLAEVFGIRPEWILLGEPQEKSEPDNSDVTLQQSKPIIPEPEPFVLTNMEMSIIKIIRNLKKKEKEEVINFIQSKR